MHPESQSATPEVSENPRAGGVSFWTTVQTPTAAFAFAWVSFQLYLYFYPGTDSLIGRSGHVCFALALALNVWADAILARIPRILMRAAAVITLAPVVFMALEIDRIRSRTPLLDELLPTEIILASLLLIALMVVGYRVVGLGLVLVVAMFVGYQFLGTFMPGILRHRETDLFVFLENQFLTTQGMFGVPTGISAEVVFYFILFAAVFNAYGGGRMIMDLALAMTGRHRGGPAKCAIIASGLMGSVSGSAVANVMGSGIFTIPLMRKLGYQPRFAAAVEAVASTGGQIMPPVMGAGVFIMADMLQIPYSDIVLSALIPALLFFGSLYIVVHLQAGRSDLGGLSESQVPNLREAILERGHMLLPLIWLAAMVVSGLGVTDATMQAVALTVVLGTLRASTRATPSDVAEALINSAKRTISVALPCALASVIVSVIAYSGLGTKFTAILIQLADEKFAVMLAISMIGSLILGAGMPTTSAYIMSAVLIAPALVQLGGDALSVHLFIYYFAILSMITPPVALAAFAAATIAESDPGATGVKAIFIAFPILLIPYLFFTHPAILLDDTVANIAIDSLISIVMMFAAAAAVIGWFSTPLSKAERFLLAALAVTVGFAPTIVGLAGTGAIVLLLGLKFKSARNLAALPEGGGRPAAR